MGNTATRDNWKDVLHIWQYCNESIHGTTPENVEIQKKQKMVYYIEHINHDQSGNNLALMVTEDHSLRTK
jgi:hypothetical protein